MKFEQGLRLWIPVVFWCGVIFIFSSIPTLPAPKILWWDFVLKKSAHVIEYAILYLLVFRALRNSSAHAKGRAVVSCFLFCLLYAISDEYHQSFIPGRHAKTMDIGFDFLGMLISFRRIKNDKLSKPVSKTNP